MMSFKVERRDVFWYVLLRLIVVTSIFVAAVIIQLAGAAIFPLIPILRLLFVGYVCSIVYGALYVLDRHYAVQAYIQVVFDLFLITAFVYISGGIASAMYFLYVFAVIAASLVISGRAAYLAASLAAILFGLLVDGMYFGLIPYFSPEHDIGLSFGTVLLTLTIAWASFFVIAALTNYLSGNLKRTRAELRRAQKDLIIKERLAEAGRMAAGLAHEIRNPLAAISGSVQVLKDEIGIGPEARELMNIVLKESVRVSQSIDQFLDFASPTKQDFSEVDLSGLLDETLKILRGSGALNGRVTVAGNFREADTRIFGSANQFRQVFWNLVKNALQAMPGGGTLTMDLDKRREDVLIRFADTGKGMTDEDQAHLFEPFYSNFANGRGLGMAAVRRIVDDYEGRIDVNSELGRGTEITISIPRSRRL